MRHPSPHRLLALLGSLVLAGPAPAAQVTRFAPQGTVKQVRQASAVFSEPMVAFGDPAAADPFDVTCPVPGQGRWVDTGQWVYDFERDLPAGHRCAFRLRAGLATLGGQALTGPRELRPQLCSSLAALVGVAVHVDVEQGPDAVTSLSALPLRWSGRFGAKPVRVARGSGHASTWPRRVKGLQTLPIITLYPKEEPRP